MQARGLDGVLRTPLDLELELQVSRTRHIRLSEELRVLRQLKEQLESARQQGQHSLPAWVQEDERFRLLLTQAERQVIANTHTHILHSATYCTDSGQMFCSGQEGCF